MRTEHEFLELARLARRIEKLVVERFERAREIGANAFRWLVGHFHSILQDLVQIVTKAK